MGSDAKAPTAPKIWWSNAIFFVSIHIAAFIGAYYFPVYAVHRASLFLAFLVWQLADFGYVLSQSTKTVSKQPTQHHHWIP